MIENGWTEELDRLREALERTKRELDEANKTIQRYEERFEDFRAFINTLSSLLEARLRGE